MEILQSSIAPLSLCAAVATGLLGGVFFAFSNFVMKALAFLPNGSGAEAMRSINRVVLNPLFLSIFTGAAFAGAVLGIFAVTHWQNPGSGALLTGSLLYLAGGFFVTAAGNVPLNNALATADPEDPAVWQDYLKRWTRWNHVRAVACLAACGFFIAAHGRMG